MAGKSGRTISAEPKNILKSQVFSWEGILVLLFLAVILFCMFLSPNFKLNNVLREMPKYLAEIFIMLPMVFILVMGEIDISLGSVVCLSATAACMVSNAGMPLPVVIVVCLLTGAAGETFDAGDMGKYTIVEASDGGTEIILGAPFKFDSSNIEEWATVY